MNLSLQSKYRTELMGIAILLVIFFHSSMIDLGGGDLLRKKADIGVNFFLHLSALGLYFSWKKDCDIVRFLKKRLLRIYPKYWIALIFFFLVGLVFKREILISNVILLATGFNFFIMKGNLEYWYISAILMLYLFTPFYLKLFEKNKIKITILTLFCSFLLICLDRETGGTYLIFSTRIPSFILGFYFGALAYEKKEIPRYWVDICWLISLSGIILLGWYDYLIINQRTEYFWKYIIFIIFTPSSILVISSLLQKGNKKFDYAELSILGQLTFELYLFHEKFVLWFKPFRESMNYDGRYILYSILLCIFAFFFCKLFNEMLNYGINLLGNRK